MATFSASGQNVLGINGTSKVITSSTLYSNCNVTVTNNSNQSQTITYYIKLTVNGVTSYESTTTGTAVILSASNNSSGTNCANNSSSSCTFPFGGSEDFSPRLTPNGSPQSQTVACSGWIEVDDTTTGSPGFVTAAGSLTTYQETAASAGLGAGGGDGRTTTTTPTVTPLIINGGSPF